MADTAHLNKDFGQGLNQLMDAVRAQGGNPVVVSGYRTRADQARIAANPAEHPGRPVAAPGTSLHEKGLAADIEGDDRTIQLMNQLAPKFGITGIHGDRGHYQWAAAGGGEGGPVTGPGGPLPLADRMAALENLLGTSDTSMGTMSNDLGKSPTDLGQASTNLGQTSTTMTAGTSGTNSTQPTATSGAPGDIDSFMARLAQQESGGNYNAKNPSGAFGKYQILPSNWATWAKEAGLPPNAPMTPENQELVARHKIEQYHQQFGDWNLVAKAWYSGPGNVHNNVSGGAGYPDSNTYARQVAGG